LEQIQVVEQHASFKRAGKDDYKSIESQRFSVDPEAYDTWGPPSSTHSFGGLNFEKEIPLTCFDGFDDVQMSVFDLTQSITDSIIVQIACLKNPSDISVGNLGDMYFGVYYNDFYMGNVAATDTETNPISNDICTMDMVAAVSMQNPLGPESPLYITKIDMTVDMGYNGVNVEQAKTFETDVSEPNDVMGNDVLTVPAFATMEVRML